MIPLIERAQNYGLNTALIAPSEKWKYEDLLESGGARRHLPARQKIAPVNFRFAAHELVFKPIQERASFRPE